MSILSEIIRREAAERGVLPFARFMELALYCPVHGYYEAEKDNPGRQGDFYTSVGVGDLFGQLLAFQFAEWLEPLRNAECGVRIVEAGAHDGRLAKDILAWLESRRPALFGQIEYWIIEPSPRRQEWQKETLKGFTPHVRWFTGFQELMGRDSVEPAQPSTPINREQALNPRLQGVIFSNELLDAMPVHRLGWDAAKKTWFEWGVAVEGGKFVWTKIPNLQSAIRHPQLEAVLPDGYTIETCPAAEDWWRAAAAILAHGKLMTIDYGLTAGELFSAGRPHGTLRAYFRHHVSDDLLANAGEQDLTAHVNFSAIQKTGEACGLATETFSTQSQFLTQILAKASKDDALDGWTSAQARQFQTLTHPEHLGRAFRVMVQSRFNS